VSDRPAPPIQLTAKPQPLSLFAYGRNLTPVGADRPIIAYGALTTTSPYADQLLTYATSLAYLDAFLASPIAACVLHESLAAKLPPDRSALITRGDPADAFYTLFRDSVLHGEWAVLSAYRGTGTQIAPSAQIHDNVVIGDGCVIMDNVVVFPQTYIADGVVVKPNATIGGEGFQLAPMEGRRRPVPHAGGVYIGEGASIGSQTCIDRGLFGELTTIGADTHIDNLVHIAHSVSIGRDAAVVACTEISGSVTVDDGAWLGPNCSVNPGLRISKHALIGTGSAVIQDIPPHALAYGVPARVRGWRCMCGERLPDLPEPQCLKCARQFDFSSGHPVLVADSSD
jgi:UDP-3-O-[3-hydroxymyristoyl] glucosamine N-acyltransferase